MKKLRIPIMIIAILIALYEQSSADKNIYITIIAIVIFMIGMMQLSAKTPSENQDKEEEDVE
jgi:NADH:ubiquinone oxidoreductase subunit H